MTKPNALILSGYGINCEEETAFAFETAGAQSRIVHINDLINKEHKLKDYQILAFPGGFSYGDDTGSGKAFANKVRDNLFSEVIDFINEEKLIIGICNGFQILKNLGLVPAFDNNYGERNVSLTHNTSARYYDRWVDLEFTGKGPWVKEVGVISMPIAHGEGRFYAEQSILEKLEQKGMIAARYVEGIMCNYQNMEANPNGSLEDIAAITDESGRILGMMPHPERAIAFTQRPDWPVLKRIYRRKGEKLPEESQGMLIFRNGVDYFK